MKGVSQAFWKESAVFARQVKPTDTSAKWLIDLGKHHAQIGGIMVVNQQWDDQIGISKDHKGEVNAGLLRCSGVLPPCCWGGGA